MHPLIEEHGKELMRELLDIIFINQGKGTMGDWLAFCKKYNLVTKRTSIIQSRIWYNDRYEYSHWFINLRNGRGMDVFTATIKDEELLQIRKELVE